jgi:tetratricopeptide (TPR) repeat protein
MARLALPTLLVFLIACAGGGGGLPEASGLVLQGEAALEARRFDEAAELFATAAAEPGGAFLGRVGLARTAVARRDARALDGAITQAMAADPGTPASRDLLGRTLLAAARSFAPPDRRYLTVALAYFRRAAEDDPELPHLRFHAGLAAYELGDLDFAGEAWEAAHALDPEAADPLRALLDLRRRQGDRASLRRLLDGEARRRGGVLPPSFDAYRRAAEEPTSRP